MVKVKANAMERQSIMSVASIFRAKIVDVGPESLIIELTGAQSKLDYTYIYWKAMRSWNLPEPALPACPGEWTMSAICKRGGAAAAC